VTTNDSSHHPAQRWLDAAGATLTSLLVTIACGLLVWHDPYYFWNDDYQLMFLPAFEEINRAWRAGEWPLLTESSWVCGNLAGEYQYGTFSVFINACIVAVWSFGLSLPAKAAAFSMVHQAVLAAGSFTLARSRGITPPLATLVAVVACLNGWNICWAATNWIAALTAFAWLPWAWWAMEQTVALPQARWPVVATAVFLYLVLTAGWPFTVLMLLVITGWIAADQLARGLRGRQLAVAAARLTAGWLAGGLLALPALWMLLTSMQGSQRASDINSLQWTWVMPPTALPALVVPTVTAVWETFFDTRRHVSLELAGGLVPLAILGAGLLEQRGRLDRQVCWLLGLAGVALTAAMLPSMGVFRWSFRWLPLFHLALVLAAAELASRRRPRQTPVVALGLVAGGGLWLLATGGSQAEFDWHAAELLVIVVAWVGDALIFQRLNWRHTAAVTAWLPAVVAAGTLTALFLRVPPNLAVPVAPLGENLLAATPLEPDRLYLSAYFGNDIPTRPQGDSRRFGAAIRPGNTAMFAGVRTINGYSPIHPAGIARMLPFETHGFLSPEGWAWVLRHALGPGEVFDQLGIDGLIVSSTAAQVGLPPAAEWQQVWQTEEARLFHRKAAGLNAATLLRSNDPAGQRPEKLPLAVARRQRLAVDIPAEGQARLVIVDRPWHAGWRATIDGSPATVVAFEQVGLAVRLAPGQQGRLELAYEPAGFMIGGPIALATLVCLLGWLAGLPRASRLPPPETAAVKTAQPAGA